MPRFPLYESDDNKTEEYLPQLLDLCLVAEYQTIGSKPFLSFTAVNKTLHSTAQFDGIWRKRMEEFEETVGFRGLFNQLGIDIKSIVPPRWYSDQKREMRDTSLPWEHWALEDPSLGDENWENILTYTPKSENGLGTDEILEEVYFDVHPSVRKWTDMDWARADLLQFVYQY